MKYVIFLSVIAALGGFLFGYDTAVISGTTEDVKAFYNLSDIQQGWYVGCAILGCIIGGVGIGILHPSSPLCIYPKFPYLKIADEWFLAIS